jgi:hypothetical protein
MLKPTVSSALALGIVLGLCGVCLHCVNSAEVLNEYVWNKRLEADRLTFLHMYMWERGHSTANAGTHLAMRSPYCHLWVNHEYKFIYIEQVAAGTQAIIDNFKICHTGGFNLPTCMESMDSHDNATALWEDYYAFSFVRDPYTRIYEVYKSLMSRAAKKGCAVAWEIFCRDPDVVLDTSRSHPDCFEGNTTYTLARYLGDQSSCLLSLNHKFAADFVGKVEDFATDWPKLIEGINAHKMVHAPDKPNITTTDHVTAFRMSTPPGDSPHCQASIEELYALDSVMLHYT